MSTVETEITSHFIPIHIFNICLIDGKTKKNITAQFPTRKDGAFYLDKFVNYIRINYQLSLQEYCKQYLNFNWPKCLTSHKETGYKLNGKGVNISTFRQGGISKEHCPKFKEACEKFSVERMGEGNPMFGKEAWNKGLDISHPTIQRMAQASRDREVSEETRLKLSAAFKKRTVYPHAGHFHSEETKQKLREITAKRYHDKVYDRVSSIETKVKEFLNILDVKFEEQYHFKYYSLDFALVEHKISIECNGTFFHVDPRVYPNGPINAVQRRNFGRDKAKKNYLNQKGWSVIELWEIEINDGQFKDILVCKLKELKILES